MDFGIRAARASASFTAAGMAATVDTIQSRPGYPAAVGGPALASGGDAYDQRPILPNQVRFVTTGDIQLRYRLGRAADGTELYADDVASGLAGETIACSPDIIVKAGTTSDFWLGWP